MSRTRSLAASLALALCALAGCGDGAHLGAPAAPTPAGVAQAPATAAPAPAPAAPAPAPAAQTPVTARPAPAPGYAVAAKSDLRRAVSIIESYAMGNGGYAAAPGAPGLPATVTIAAVRTDGYSLVAGTTDGTRYTIERAGATTIKRCAPLDRLDCRTGEW